MVINVSKEFIFVPEFNGNKNAPECDRIVVRIKNPTLAVKARIAAHPETVARADTKGVVEGIDIRLKSNDDMIIREMLLSIEGLEYESDGNRTAVKNAAALFAAPVEFEPLRNEIASECNRILSGSEVSRKNS